MDSSTASWGPNLPKYIFQVYVEENPRFTGFLILICYCLASNAISHQIRKIISNAMKIGWVNKALSKWDKIAPLFSVNNQARWEGKKGEKLANFKYLLLKSIDIVPPQEHWLSIEVLQVRSNARFLSESYHCRSIPLGWVCWCCVEDFFWFMGKIPVGSIDSSIYSWEQNCF